MKDINKIYRECRWMLENIGMFPEEPEKVVVNKRAKTRWGCVKRRNGKITALEISEKLLDDSLPDRPAYETMLHELLHCLPECRNAGHRGAWRKAADVVQRRYGYKITTATDYSEYGIKDKRKWVTTCPDCGEKYYRDRRMKGTLLCGKCHAVLPAWVANIEEPEPARPKKELVASQVENKTLVRFNGKEYYV